MTSPVRTVDHRNDRRPASAVDRRRFARDGIFGIAGTIVNQFAGVAIIFTLTRVVSQREVGIYSQAFAVRALLMLVAGLGMRISMTYFVSLARADNEGGRARGDVRLGLASSALAATLMAAVLAAIAEPLAVNQFSEPGLTTPLRLMALSLPFIVIMTTALAATQGFQTTKALTGVSLMLEPAVRLIVTLAAIAAGFAVIAALNAVVLASVIAAAASLVTLHRYMQALPPGAPVYRARELSSYSKFSWLASVASQGLLWSDIVILGIFSTSDEVAVYQVASRVVLLATLFVTPLNASYAPRVTHTWRLGMISDLRRYYRQTAMWTFALSAPLIVAASIFASEVLGIFGGGYQEGRVAIWILMAGSLTQAATTPAAITLNQTGFNRVNTVINAAVLAINISLNLVLIPAFGIEGAAVAWLAALLSTGVAQVVVAKRRATGVWPISDQHIYAIVALAAASVVGITFRLFAPLTGTWSAIVGGGLMLAVYAALFALFHLRSRRAAVGTTDGVLKQIDSVIERMRSWKRDRHVASLPKGDTPLDIAHLISPFRYDVVVRTQFFELAKQHEAVWQRDIDEFVEIAWDHSYGRWFRAVAVHAIGVTPDDEAQLRRAFTQRVTQSLRLLQRYHESGGFDPRYPITVREYNAETMPSGVRLRDRRFLPVDGCHRLALMLAEGRHVLEAHEYRIETGVTQLLDNTARLHAILEISDDEYVRFIACGFVDDESVDSTDLIAELRMRFPDLADDVQQMMTIHRQDGDSGHGQPMPAST